MPVNKSANDAIANVSATTSTLTITLNGKTLDTGEYVPRAETQAAPEITFPSAKQSTTYLAVMLDMEAPFPSFNFLSPILHWILPGLQPSEGGKLSSSEREMCDYVAAGPPPGSGPHQYVVFLYEQPDGFDAKKHALGAEGRKVGVAKRVRYDLDAFEKEAGLGKIVGCNWFKSH